MHISVKHAPFESYTEFIDGPIWWNVDFYSWEASEAGNNAVSRFRDPQFRTVGRWNFLLPLTVEKLFDIMAFFDFPMLKSYWNFVGGKILLNKFLSIWPQKGTSFGHWRRLSHRARKAVEHFGLWTLQIKKGPSNVFLTFGASTP